MVQILKIIYYNHKIIFTNTKKMNLIVRRMKKILDSSSLIQYKINILIRIISNNYIIVIKSQPFIFNIDLSFTLENIIR